MVQSGEDRKVNRSAGGN